MENFKRKNRESVEVKEIYKRKIQKELDRGFVGAEDVITNIDDYYPLTSYEVALEFINNRFDAPYLKERNMFRMGARGPVLKCLMDNIDLFERHDHQKIIEALFDAGLSRVITEETLSKVEDIDYVKLMEKIGETSYSSLLNSLPVLQKFFENDSDFLRVVIRITVERNPKIWVLRRKLSKNFYRFKNLDSDIKEKLIDLGLEDVVNTHPESFA